MVYRKRWKKGPIHTELREQVHVTSNQNNIIPFVTAYNSSVFVIVIILEAKLNGLFILICFG
jgi:dsDNA-specific endonuclease/ATPase MutS2